MTNFVKYPHISVQLTVQDGNAFYILGKIKQALQRNKIPQAEIDQFIKEATSGDYDNLLRTCMKTVNVN
uniref:Uncharacterized protein n=1 Tax=viral metagenome TaxID=1070528 RepID=A0A6M3JMG3_9ZZZZ